MQKNNDLNMLFFPKESNYKFGKTTYVVTSHYNENSEILTEKIKKLLKSDIRQEMQNTGLPGVCVV